MITIITDPILSFSEIIIRATKRSLVRIIKRKKNLYELRYGVYKDGVKYGGHYSVTRSFLEGLDKSKISYTYNPKKIQEFTSDVILLAGISALKQAIGLKKRGIIKKLYAGPNIVVSPLDEDNLLCSPYIDQIIVPSGWVKSIYITQAPTLKEKIVIWPAGVNQEFWKPIGKKNTKEIIFYKKRAVEEMYQECKKYAEENGYKVNEIIYGKYDVPTYLNALQSASLLVHFVEQESQGISLSEAWSMNVPTFVWNPGYWQNKSVNYLCESSPYLSEQTGNFFYETEGFKKILLEFDASKYSPREWVLQNFTDEICASQLLKLLNL